jgi:hypothetical protein
MIVWIYNKMTLFKGHTKSINAYLYWEKKLPRWSNCLDCGFDLWPGQTKDYKISILPLRWLNCGFDLWPGQTKDYKIGILPLRWLDCGFDLWPGQTKDYKIGILPLRWLDCEFDLWPGQTNDYKISISCFSDKKSISSHLK